MLQTAVDRAKSLSDDNLKGFDDFITSLHRDAEGISVFKVAVLIAPFEPARRCSDTSVE